MTTENIATDFQLNTDKFLAWADMLSPEQLQRRPAPGKWSVFEVLEHIFIVEKSAAKLAAMEAEVVERDLEKSRRRMEKGLGDTSQSYFGGNIVDPKGRFTTYPEWRAAFVANRVQLLELSAQKGWMGLCTGYPHPYFGNLTRAEWVIMSGYHADRHLEQMKAFVDG